MRRIAISAVLGLLSLGALPASAEPHVRYVTGEARWDSPGGNPTWTSYCRLEAVAQENVSGGPDTFTGILVGAAAAFDTASGTGEDFNLRCTVHVNGSAVDEADDGPSFGGVDTEHEPTTFVADETDTITVCIALGLGAGGPECAETTTTQVPPQEVYDLLHVANFLVCPVLASLSPGVPGVVDIDWDGDVSVLGVEVHDCPPYGF